jgi:hypothetical protein
MKGLKHLFLICGLLSSAVCGQSTPKQRPSVVAKCGTLSCNSSISFIPRANPRVILGVFESFHERVLNLSACGVVCQAFGFDKQEETQMPVKNTASLPAIAGGLRTLVYAEPDRRATQGMETK